MSSKGKIGRRALISLIPIAAIYLVVYVLTKNVAPEEVSSGVITLVVFASIYGFVALAIGLPLALWGVFERMTSFKGWTLWKAINRSPWLNWPMLISVLVLFGFLFNVGGQCDKFGDAISVDFDRSLAGPETELDASPESGCPGLVVSGREFAAMDRDALEQRLRDEGCSETQIANSLASFGEADVQRTRWDEQWVHWENVDAFMESMNEIGADRVIDKRSHPSLLLAGAVDRSDEGSS